MTLTNKRKIVAFRRAFKIAYKTFWNVLKFQHYEKQHPALEPFKKKHPMIDRNEHTVQEKYQLSPKEKLYVIEREIHNLRCEIMLNEGNYAGRLTREQTYFLCMYKRERDALQKQYMY